MLRPFALVSLALAACASSSAEKAPLRHLPRAHGGPTVEERPRPPRRRETIQTILPQNVRVVVASEGIPSRSASGVSLATEITPEGVVSFVLTNAHVVEVKELVEARFLVLVETPAGDTQEFAAELVARGQVPEADLAVLSVHGIRIAAATLADDDDLLVGDDVVVVAAPYGRPPSVSGGMVSQIEFEKGLPRKPQLIKTDAAIGYGASGGGMYSVESGKLIGIVEGYRTAKVSIPLAQDTYSFDVPMPGETFGAPVAKIRKFLARKGLSRIARGGRPAGQAALD
jgi:S1-C subfamily serine protease